MERDIRREIITSFSSLRLIPHRLRAPILRLARVRIGPGSLFMAGSVITGSGPILIGDNVFVNSNCYFDTSSAITICSSVSIGDHVRILTSTHEVGGGGKRAASLQAVPVTIGKGSWIGSGVIILPGCKIGEGCIIGAGAVVVRDCIDNTLYLGVPAKAFRTLDP